MRLRAPFQGKSEQAGHGFDGIYYYDLERCVLRAFTPSVYRQWRWPFVWQGPLEKVNVRLPGSGRRSTLHL